MSTRDLLRSAGLRSTRTRTAILDELADQAGPLPHVQLLAGLGDAFDRVTVYRTLKTLIASDLVGIAGHEGGQPLYVLGRAHVEDHAHFVCTQCSESRCLPQLEISGDLAPEWQSAVHAATLQLSGTCPGCEASP